jgi:hypothetical protein
VLRMTLLLLLGVSAGVSSLEHSFTYTSCMYVRTYTSQSTFCAMHSFLLYQYASYDQVHGDGCAYEGPCVEIQTGPLVCDRTEGLHQQLPARTCVRTDLDPSEGKSPVAAHEDDEECGHARGHVVKVVWPVIRRCVREALQLITYVRVRMRFGKHYIPTCS